MSPSSEEIAVPPNKIMVKVKPSPILKFGDWHTSCTIGRNGTIAGADKREGDGYTPLGTYPLRPGFALTHRFADWPEVTHFAFTQPTPYDIWDNDPFSPTYNQQTRLDPNRGHEERLLRPDGLYDVIIPIGFNDDPPLAGRGSAIFLHIATSNMAPTAGCIAVPRDRISGLVRRLTPDTLIEILSD